MKTNYQKLKEAIWKANPSILELKFGCEVKLTYPEPDNVFVFDGYYCIKLDSGFRVSKEDYDKYIGFSTCHGIKKPVKILGRPIRLADILITYEMEIDGSDEMQRNLNSIVVMWNLFDNNLDNQSDECKKFLIDLLVKKL